MFSLCSTTQHMAASLQPLQVPTSHCSPYAVLILPKLPFRFGFCFFFFFLLLMVWHISIYIYASIYMYIYIHMWIPHLHCLQVLLVAGLSAVPHWAPFTSCAWFFLKVHITDDPEHGYIQQGIFCLPIITFIRHVPWDPEEQFFKSKTHLSLTRTAAKAEDIHHYF